MLVNTSMSSGDRHLLFRVAVAVLMVIAPVGALAQEHGPLASWWPRLTSYMQLRYTGRAPGRDAWGLRRSKLIFDGGSTQKRARYHVQVIYKHNNGSRTDDTLYLQDAYVVVHTGKIGWTIGQFKPPFGLERFQPDARLDFVDRTQATNRLIVNGKLGDSFTRDRGVQADLDEGGLRFSLGIFQGGGANMDQHGNGPLGVVHVHAGRHGHRSGTVWDWKVGMAASFRHAEDLDLGAALKGAHRGNLHHFKGNDQRLNLFVAGRWGRLRGQAELFRAWLAPDVGASWKAQGAYGQVAFLPARGLSLAVRNEWMTPDTCGPAIAVHNWTAAVAYDFSRTPLRLVTDETWSVGGSSRMNHVWRFQIQYVIAKGMPLTH